MQIRLLAFAGFLLVLVVTLGSYSWYQARNTETLITVPTIVPEETQNNILVTDPINNTLHVALPSEVRGIYWTADSAGGKRGEELLAYMEARGLNTAVIDLKLDNGALAFIPKDERLKSYVAASPPINNLETLLQRLGERKIYRIARLAVMRDSTFAKLHPDHAMQTAGGGLWRDKTYAAWADPASPLVADYALTLAREAYAAGFDEIQFDYIRFASDGVLSSIRYSQYDEKTPKWEVMRSFFDKMNVLREEGIPVSYDVFGMTFWSTQDFNIGQRLEDVLPNADFISPMVYPSHYPPNFEGLRDPALAPYEIVKKSLDKGAEILRTDRFIEETTSRPKFRPWLQDFDIGAVYTAARIEAQIKAARDAGASGWMLWNARNVYEPANYLINPPSVN